MITPEKAAENLDQFRRPMWSFDEIKRWFGCDLEAAPQRLLAQYRIWATRYEDKTEVLDMEGKRIHRNIFELFLQDRELLPISFAALRWGMDVASFTQVLRASFGKDLISEAEGHGEFHGVFKNSFIAGFHRRFANLNRITFSNFNGYVRLLHKEIQDFLEIAPSPAYCATSVALGHNPTEFGYNFDCISGDPVGLGYQIWLETGKPIQLELDGCSWLTMEKYFDALNGLVLGTLREDFEVNRQILRRYIDESS